MAHKVVAEKIIKVMINSADGRKIEIAEGDCPVCPNCDKVPPWWYPRGCSICGYKLGDLKPAKSHQAKKN